MMSAGVQNVKSNESETLVDDLNDIQEPIILQKMKTKYQ